MSRAVLMLCSIMNQTWGCHLFAVLPSISTDPRSLRVSISQTDKHDCLKGLQFIGGFLSGRKLIEIYIYMYMRGR